MQKKEMDRESLDRDLGEEISDQKEAMGDEGQNTEAENKQQSQIDEPHENNEREPETSEVDKLKNEMEEMKNLAQRTQADFINYKKRVEKEKKDISAFANERIMTELLEVIDNFERALASGKAEETDEEGKTSGFYQGVEMILKQLTDRLAKFGLAEIQAEGTDFDPNYHHAVMQVEADQPDKVVEVLQKGYLLKEKVIRPSMVKVSQ